MITIFVLIKFIQQISVIKLRLHVDVDEIWD